MKLFKRICDGCSLEQESSEDKPGSFRTVKMIVNENQFHFTLDLCGNCFHKDHRINISACGIVKEKNEA